VRWVTFNPGMGQHQTPPEPKKYLLLQTAGAPDRGLPPAVVVGYFRFAAGDRDSPAWTIPGVGFYAGRVVAWSDSLPDDFWCPEWPGTHGTDRDMRLWLITRHRQSYCSVLSCVVRAESEEEARRIAGGRYDRDMGGEELADPARSRCVAVTAEGEPGVIHDACS
jgi:hypothetical protein